MEPPLSNQLKLNTLEESAPETVHEFTSSLVWFPTPLTDGEIIQIVDRPKDVLPSLVIYASVLLVVTISAMNCFVTGSTRLMKIIVSRGRMVIMMQPSMLLNCFTLVACFSGHADAFGFGYPEGLCLKTGTGIDGCTANDVTANVTNFIGPSTCEFGTSVTGTITTTIDVQASTRYDLGVYIGLGGANALSDQGNKSCLVQTLRESDNATGNVGQFEGNKNDDCLDVSKGEIVGFQIKNFTIECKSTPGNYGAVTISACFVWDQNAGANCPINCTAPNTNLQCVFPGSPAVSCPPPTFQIK